MGLCDLSSGLGTTNKFRRILHLTIVQCWKSSLLEWLVRPHSDKCWKVMWQHICPSSRFRAKRNLVTISWWAFDTKSIQNIKSDSNATCRREWECRTSSSVLNTQRYWGWQNVFRRNRLAHSREGLNVCGCDSKSWHKRYTYVKNLRSLWVKCSEEIQCVGGKRGLCCTVVQPYMFIPAWSFTSYFAAIPNPITVHFCNSRTIQYVVQGATTTTNCKYSYWIESTPL